MMVARAEAVRRYSLDALVAQMAEPGFISRYRRAPSARQTGAHVIPDVLAFSSPRSQYVRKWRRHARRCPSCANAFRYFGLPVD